MPNTSDRALLTSQKNHLFKQVQDAGMDPADFEVAEDGTHRRASFFHHPTAYYFSISIDDTTPFTISLSPGETLLKERRLSNKWENVAARFWIWLTCIRREIELPDLWDGLATGSQLVQDATEQPSDNLPFAQAELPQVRKALEEIKAYVIKTKELTETQRKIVDARFDHMEEAATRMGRKDWLSLVIGNLLGIAFSLALTGDSTRDLFGFVALVFKRILGTMLYLASPH